MFLLALLSLALGLSWVQADPCPSNLYLPFSLYTDSMGCVFADPYDKYEKYSLALNRCREIFGPRGRLVEIHSLEDQQAILPIMQDAEDTFYDEEDVCISWWWTGLTDMNDDGIWEWPEGGSANFTYWHDAAVPEMQNYNCMQLLSATCYDGRWMTFQCSDAFINTHPICQLPN